jgi:predicted RNA binding protein YcfA (HicA-like mRNA interferase family)
MKTKEFLRILKDMGYALIRTGKHEIWGRPGHHIAIPHGSNGKEINKMVARRILKEIGFQGRVQELNYG